MSALILKDDAAEVAENLYRVLESLPVPKGSNAAELAACHAIAKNIRELPPSPIFMQLVDALKNLVERGTDSPEHRAAEAVLRLVDGEPA